MSDSDYPWEVIPDPDAGGYTIRFPDLPGCMTCVETLYHINNTAAEIRDLWLGAAREAGMAIPEPGSHEANVKRLRELERACRYVIIRDIGPKGITWRLNPYSNQLHSAAVATIGRLLEGDK